MLPRMKMSALSLVFDWRTVRCRFDRHDTYYTPLNCINPHLSTAQPEVCRRIIALAGPVFRADILFQKSVHPRLATVLSPKMAHSSFLLTRANFNRINFCDQNRRISKNKRNCPNNQTYLKLNLYYDSFCVTHK